MSNASEHFFIFCSIEATVSAGSDCIIIYKRKFSDEAIENSKYLVKDINPPFSSLLSIFYVTFFIFKFDYYIFYFILIFTFFLP